VVEQPSNRGTAAGVLFPLSVVLNQDPDATVFIVPSDHFLYPERRFHQYVTEAMHLAETYKEGLVLIGASPDRAEPDYGWIRPGFVAAQSRIRRRSFMVRGFCEKPSRSVSERLFEDGWLWNTMMLAVKARVLWNIAQATIGNIVERFETFGKVVHAVYEGRVPFDHMDIAADHIYADLPTTDLSRDIIQPAAEQRLVEPIVLPIKDIQWSDWGRPERIVSTLSKLPGYDRGLLFDRDLSWDLVGKRFEMEKDAVATC